MHYMICYKWSSWSFSYREWNKSFSLKKRKERSPCCTFFMYSSILHPLISSLGKKKVCYVCPFLYMSWFTIFVTLVGLISKLCANFKFGNLSLALFGAILPTFFFFFFAVTAMRKAKVPLEKCPEDVKTSSHV